MRIDGSLSDIASRVCLDHSKCSVKRLGQHPILIINKGARVLSNTSHLACMPQSLLPFQQLKHASAIQYTAKKRIRLIICDRDPKNRDSVYLRHLVTQKQALSITDKKRAIMICMENRVDGWFVKGDEKRKKIESLVLLFPKQVLL